jgi:hypothetical protein
LEVARLAVILLHMPAVNSSAISRVEFDDSSGVLSIWFTAGHRYDYPGVPRELYQRLITSTSIGTFFNNHIRDQYSANKGDY